MLPNSSGTAMAASRLAAWTAVALTLALCCVSCGGDKTNDGTVRASIGVAGAVVTGPGNTVITFPAGAVQSTFSLTVSNLPSAQPPPGFALVATPLRLTPKTQSFTEPVTITIPITALPAGNTVGDVWVLRGDADTVTYVPLPVAPSGSAVIAQTDLLGDFLAVVPIADGGTPFGTCGSTVCDATESCSSCPLDCQLCLTGPPTDSGVPFGCNVTSTDLALVGTAPRALAIAGNVLLGASDLISTGGFRAFDLADPAAPAAAGTFDFAAADRRQIAVSGTAAFVTDGIRIVAIDISNLAQLTLLGDYDLDADTVLKTALGNPVNGVKSRGIALSGNYAYVSTSDRGLVVFDVSTPGVFTRVGYVTDASLGAGDVVIAGTRAYVVSYENQFCIPGPCVPPNVRGVLIYDISTPASPTRIGTADVPSSSPTSLAFSGTNAFMTSTTTQYWPLDLASASAPVIGTPIETNGFAYSAFVRGSLLFVASNSVEPHLQVYSIATPATPVRGVDQMLGGTGGSWAVVAGPSYVYVGVTDRLVTALPTCQ